MATRWSSEFIVAEHRDLQASAMAVDSTGIYVLLAGRRYLGLKNLNDATDSLKKFPRQSKYEVGAAEWNPHSHQELCAISTNQRVEILSLANGGMSLTHTLCAHTRAVSDLNWHQFDGNLIASCSIDTFTYIWDLRDTRRPSVSLSTVAGASHVRWNRLSRFLLATAHDGDIKLWDQRKGTAPVQYITAHLSNIHSLDWSPNNENQLATSSQDCTVKFFDTTNPRRAENILSSAAPVWRARYTPFGNGLLMVVVPPMRRGDNSLLLWNLSNRSAPVHSFVGHTDIVLEFAWRRSSLDSSNYQLITWSKDQTLRIWQIEPFLQKLCGIQPEVEVQLASHATDEIISNPSNLGNDVESPAVVETRNLGIDLSEGCLSESEVTPAVTCLPPTQPKTLHQEFSLVNVNIRYVTVDSMDAEKRTCTLTAEANGNVAVVHIIFPTNYPHNIAPLFQFTAGTTVDSAMKAKLLKVLKQTAMQRVKKNRSCLEPCIRQLVSTLEQFSHNEDSEKSQMLRGEGSLLQHSSLYSNFQNAFIPFPRTSGAKFSNVDTLVCFGRIPGPRHLSRLEMPTPRALSALSTFSESPLNPSSIYFHERHVGQGRNRVGRNLPRGMLHKARKAIVVLYDVSNLFPISRELAEKYVFDSVDVAGMCQRNSQVAASVGRKDLAQAWSLAVLAATPPTLDLDEDFPWVYHPLSIGMIHSLITHYAKQSDIQTAAMLCCAFGTKAESDVYKNKNLSKVVNISPGGSPYHTIHQIDSSLESWGIPVMKQNRSNSWSESLDGFSVPPNIIEHLPMDMELEKSPSRVLLNDSWLYDQYKLAYAEILQRWRLLDARVQVMKYLVCTPEVHRGIELVSDCPSCKTVTKEPQCTTCKKFTFMCIICHTSVRGASNVCLLCGHGGHTQHMKEWFALHDVCATGCGCQCLTETASLLDP